MKSFLAVVSVISFDHFIETGTFEVKPFLNESLPSEGDEIYIATVCCNHAYGPFRVIDSRLRSYAFGNAPSMICEANGIIDVVDIQEVSEPCISIVDFQIKTNNDELETITGNLELDGLLSNAMFDSRLKSYYVFFLSNNRELESYYIELLNKYNIECYHDNKGRVFIKSDVLCERCAHLDIG